MAETSAVAARAPSLRLDSSLAAVDFYKANGFVESGRGEHRLRHGRTMDTESRHGRGPSLHRLRLTPAARAEARAASALAG